MKEEIWDKLPNNEKLILIEKVMPCSVTHRQLDNEGYFSEGQIKEMCELFINLVIWEKLHLLEVVSVHDKAYEVEGISTLNNKFSAIGLYSCEVLESITDIKII